MMTHDAAGKGGRVKSPNTVKWKVLIPKMSLQAGFRMETSLQSNEAAKTWREEHKKSSKDQEIHNKHPFTQMGKGLEIQHGRERAEALNSPAKELHEDVKHCLCNPLWQGRFDFLSYIKLYIRIFGQEQEMRM